MKHIVGNVTEEEKKEILSIFERRNGLNELAKIVSIENVELYEKLVKDLGETNIRFQNWWERMADKYQWEGKDGSWEIDFKTNDIYLT